MSQLLNVRSTKFFPFDVLTSLLRTIEVFHVSPSRSSSDSFTPLATYLSLRSLQVSDEETELPSIEIIKNYAEDTSNELPPGTKIITQPMTSGRGWGHKLSEAVQTRRPSRTSEDLSINNIVKRLQQVVPKVTQTYGNYPWFASFRIRIKKKMNLIIPTRFQTFNFTIKWRE